MLSNNPEQRAQSSTMFYIQISVNRKIISE